MSGDISASTIPAKIDGKGSESRRTVPAARREMELRGVIRVLINKNQRLQKPIMAAKKLATRCQGLKDEVERMKQVSNNYKTGMERAERRSAQLQQDLARAYKAAGSEDKIKTESLKEKSMGLPFYLPASMKQFIDSLAANNIMLMKSVQKLNNSEGNIDQILKENLKMERMIKSLREELALKSSLLEDYEAEMSNKDLKCDADKLAANIILQRRECVELNAKIHSYEKYVKDLREKNTAIVDAVMTQLDKSNRGPTESADEEDKGMMARKAASAPSSSHVSRANSGSASRRASLKSEYDFCSTGIQTDLGFCTSSEKSSVDDVDMGMSPNEHEAYEREIKQLRDKVTHLSHLLQEKNDEDKRTKQRLLDMEQTWMNMENELEKWRERSMDFEKKVVDLKAEKEESEAIVKMMQERVDQVNLENADSVNREEKIREYEKRIKELEEELPMMKQALAHYEEEIKAYGVERKQLLDKQEQSQYELNGLRKRLQEHRMERVPSQFPDNQADWFHQGSTQRRQTDMTERNQPKFHQDTPTGGTHFQVPEPFRDANAQWVAHAGQRRGQLVADGGYRFDSPSEDIIHEGQRHRQLQRGQVRRRNSDLVRDDDEFTAYANADTVKCENCKERYPRGLFQDHFRDCSRDQNS